MSSHVQEPDAEQQWQQLHPLTPLLRGGRLLLVVAAVIGQQGLRDSPGVAVAIGVGVAVPLALLGGYLSWRAMRYRLTPTELQVESGILTKRSRRVPLARLQSVDVVRPLFARFLGLAELRLEVVGGSGAAEAPLSFLGEDDAQRLRGRLLDQAAGRVSADQDTAPDPEQVLVVVPTGVLVRSTLLGAPAISLVLLLLALLVASAVDLRAAGGLLAAVLPVGLGVGSVAIRRLLTEYGFTVAEGRDGLRLRHGLLDTRSQTVPPGRVQMIRIREPLLWRPFGWVRVEVDVAGYSAGGGEQQLSTSALLPVAPRELAERLVARVLTIAPPTGVTRPPRAARLRAPLSFWRLGLAVDDAHLVTTRGVLTTTTDIVPLAKVQSVRLEQGPLQQRLRLASVLADTAGRRLSGTVAAQRGQDEAQGLLDELSWRARAARARAG